MASRRGKKGIGLRLRESFAALTSKLQPAHVDVLLIVGLMFLNPILYGMRMPLNLTPDAVGYLTLARSLAESGALFLTSWGHVDTAVILPPLYPLLIAGLDLLRPDGVGNALLLSAAAIVAAGALIYLYIRRFAPASIAAAAVLLIQLNFYYVYLGGSILTEALFLLILVAALLATVRLAQAARSETWLALAVGVLAGLAFLARQVGLIAAVFIAAWLVIDAVRRESAPRGRWRPCLLFLVGWAGIMAPYATALYVQTGQTVLHQSYRMNAYVVSSVEHGMLDKIHELERAGEEDYVELYRARRQLWALTPDGSEMLAYVVPGAGDDLRATAGLPSRWWRNLKSNAGHLIERLGWAAFVVFLLACVSPFFMRPRRSPWWPRLMLPGFLAAYALGLSLVTGAIARYLVVLIPLALAHIAIELGVLYRWWRERAPRSNLAYLAVALVFAALLLLTPRSVLNAPPPLAPLDRAIVKSATIPGEPAFALQPAYAYLAGGYFRILPNDALEKVVRYAHATGVRWLLVPQEPDRILDTRFYTNAAWLRDPQGLTRRTDLVRFCCLLNGPRAIEDHLVFEILPPRPGPRR